METDQPLETGYGPATPRGDNLANDFAQGLTEAYLALATARGHRIEADDDIALSDAGSPSEFANVANVRRPMGDGEWRAAAHRMHAFFAQQDGGSFLLLSAWPTPDLTPFGFGRIGHPPLMLRPPAPVDVPAVDGLEIRSVADAAGAEAWERTFIDAFPEPALQPFQPGRLLPEAAIASDGWRFWLGVLDGEPVATAAAHLSGGHVQVEYISTVEPARGRGVGGAVTAHATLTDPDLPSMLIASDLGRPVYERLGYRSMLRFTLWAGHRRPTPPPG